MPGPQGDVGLRGPTEPPGPTGPAGMAGPSGTSTWTDGPAQVMTARWVGTGLEDGASQSQLDVCCALGEPCMEVRYGNIRMVGCGSWHGEDPHNAPLLCDLNDSG